MLNWDDPLSTQKPVVTETQKTAPAVDNKPEAAVGSAAETAKPAGKPKASATDTLDPSANIALGQKPVRAEDKRVINGEGDVNQLAPFKYPWAWDYFLNANKNHWTPLDINMAQDVHDYHHKLTLEERHVFENVLSYLTTSDILAMRNIGLAVMEKMTAPELQIYQARQVYEESLHTWTYQHCIETIGLDQGEIYNRYRVVPEINAKIQVANRRLDSVLRADIDLRDPDELHNFVMAYIFFAGIFEGCWFYNGFSPIFALQRRGLMKGTAEQLQYIMRDEVMHASFGIRVAKTIIKEENLTLDKNAIREMWEEAEACEQGYANYLLPDPILGYSSEDHIAQFRFIANRRARSLQLDEPFPGAENALPWLDEQANMRKEKNFFETRVTEYQTGGALNWD
ncbi:ribonucleotide reductase [Solemya velum gill symbiont]|uniref:ribonucleotide-diphosphate reductase subunit beta n=1 Tax=Solemya velum gill symbiont TaxID=2340 RepID=UPI000998990D|nr:ribonucleotide-diphosphate reductase subunit beta [Solemya velum gill symbiont]OOZ16612.1 ribonucleotide reductase [Solemya velum gill symbiont]OOZ26715.1 ribonucleotide reductase [Solemya velum gill symbiont]